MVELCILTSFTPTVPGRGFALSSVPASIVVLPQMSLARFQGCVGAHASDGGLSLPSDDELGHCVQDVREHSAAHSQEQYTRPSCLLPRVLALHRFPAQQWDNSSTGADDQAQNHGSTRAEPLVARRACCVTHSPVQRLQRTFNNVQNQTTRQARTSASNFYDELRPL